MQDDDGEKVTSGDMIAFSFGIPPKRVECAIVQRGGVLWAVVQTRDVKPRECRLSSLRRHVGSFYKIPTLSPTPTGEKS